MTKMIGGTVWVRGAAEVCVIVVGVLIALAAEDWYAGLQEQRQEVDWVESLRDDLRHDQAALRDGLAFLDETREVIRELIVTLDDPSIVVGDTVTYLRKLKRANLAEFFRPNATTYTELTASGGMSIISNRDLVRAVIEYHQASLLTDDLNDVNRTTRWNDYFGALSRVIDPTLLAALTEDVYIRMGQWPPAVDSSLPNAGFPSLTTLRTSSDFRTALARSLDAVAVQYGDLYRLLTLCDEVLMIAESELERLTGGPSI